MIICRAILDMGITAADFKQLGRNAWNSHRSCVRNAWIRDRAAYRDRIAACVELAKQANADILLLPACALIGDVASWLPILAPVPFVVAGTLRFGLGVGRPRYIEAAVVVRQGELADRFDKTVVVKHQHAPVAVYSAISSSVGRIVNIDGQGRAVVLDAGHHTYSGRYRKVLKRVARVAAGPKGDAIAVLAFWKTCGSATSFEWVETEKLGFSWSRWTADADFLDVFLA